MAANGANAEKLNRRRHNIIARLAEVMRCVRIKKPHIDFLNASLPQRVHSSLARLLIIYIGPYPPIGTCHAEKHCLVLTVWWRHHLYFAIERKSCISYKEILIISHVSSLWHLHV